MSEVFEYKCPCCGGGIKFDSTLQKMKCEYCDTEFDLETLKQYDEMLKEQKEDDLSWDRPETQWTEDEATGLYTYICSSCGGAIIGNETLGATSCPFCGNPVIIPEKFSGGLRPDYVIPFKKSKEDAKAALRKHYEGKKLIPKCFSSENHIDEIKGMYVPFWLFDADADADVSFRCTRVTTWMDARFTYTKTDHFHVLRQGTMRFEKIPVDGSSVIDNTVMESIEPFDFSEAVDFQTAYLSGYLADKYDQVSDECVSRANVRLKASTEAKFRETVFGYNTVVPEHSSVQARQGRVLYALYPVWMLNTSWNGHVYTFAMNGQTGKMAGDLPVDKGRFWAQFFLTLGITGGAVAVLMFLLFLAGLF